MNMLFDFDGTLAQSLELVLESYQQCAPKYNLKPIDSSMITVLRTKGARELLKMSGFSPLQLPFFMTDIRTLVTEHIATVPVVPGLPAILRQLTQTGHQLAIVTSNTTENVQVFLTQHELGSLFDFIQSENNLWGKGTALQKVLQQHHLNVADTIYIGDESRDIEAARQASLKVAAVTWGFNSTEMLKAAKPDFLLDYPEQLLKIKLTS